MKNLIIPGVSLVLLITPALAQAPATFPPPPPLSAPWGRQVDVTGTVKAFTLTPIGEIEGLILTNGTEIHVPPHLTEQVVSAVRSGEAVAVRGWNTGVPNFIVAAALTGQRGQSVVDQGPPPPGLRPPPPSPGQPAPGAQLGTAQGQILQVLHGPRGDANGALLDDGTNGRDEAKPLYDRSGAGESRSRRAEFLSCRCATGAVVDNHGAVPGGERHGRDDVGLTRPHAANADRIAVLDFRFDRRR